MIRTILFPRFTFLFFLVMPSFLLTNCTQEGEKYYFEESDLLGVWISDRFDTFDGEQHDALSRLEFTNDYVKLNASSAQYDWALTNNSYTGTSTLYMGQSNFNILEITKENFSFIERRNSLDRIWFYTRE